MDEEEKMDLERETPKPEMETVPRGTFVALGETEAELKKTKAQLDQANKIIRDTKDLLITISKAALQMV
jgi:hypothetical protein